MGWVGILLNVIYFEFVFCHCDIPTIQFPEFFLFFRVLDTFDDRKVIAFETVMD